MSKEGSSYQNPIRFYQGGVISYEKGKRAFDNQKVGIYAQDPITNVSYVCTNYKTARKEPVWATINPVTLEQTTPYKVLISMGKSGDEPTNTTIDGQKITYTSDVVKKRLGKAGEYNKKAWGTFIFIAITEADLAYIKGEPTDSFSSTSPTVTSTGADGRLISLIADSKIQTSEMYEYMRTDSNGRSGFGATSPASTTTPAQINVNQGRPDYIPNWRGGIELTGGVPSPKRPSSGGPDGNTNPGSGNGSGKGGNTTTTGPGSKQPPPGTSTSVVVNFLPDNNIYSGANFNANIPYMQQIVTNFDSVNNTRQRIIRTHIFDIVPNSFEFSQLSSMWNEVERSGNYPMVDWAKYNLTKCSFRFLIAGKRTDTLVNETFRQSTVVNDGMDVSVDSQIENIRAMGGSPQPVTLHNLNTLTNTSFRFPYLNNTRNLQWVIADMSITATRLTPNGRGIAAAEVSITLNEYPIIARDIIYLPPLRPDKPVPKECKPRPCKPVDEKKVGLWIESSYTWFSDKNSENSYTPPVGP